MLRRVALLRTDVSEEFSASIIRVTRIGELGTLAVTSNRQAPSSSETSVLTRATQRNIPEDAILHTTFMTTEEIKVIILYSLWGNQTFEEHFASLFISSPETLVTTNPDTPRNKPEDHKMALYPCENHKALLLSPAITVDVTTNHNDVTCKKIDDWICRTEK
jgi:hypothetical protein